MRPSFVGIAAIFALSIFVLAESAAVPSLTFSNLTVSPVAVDAGTPVVVSMKVQNDGDAGTYQVGLEVNGVVDQKKNVTLGSGEATTVVFEVGTNAYAGDVEVSVGSQTSSFTVLLQPLPASSMVLSNFTVSPKEVAPGDPVTVSLDVRNKGGVSGLYSFQATLDGVPRTSRTGQLLPGEAQMVTFTLSSADPGTHVVEAAGLSATFTVIKPSGNVDYTLPLLVVAEAVIIVAVVAIFIRRRRSQRRKE